jgi:hypothetical protein
MAIKLELLTQNQEEITFIHRYWAMDETGAFVEPVSALLPFRDIPHGGAVAAYIRERCDAYDEDQACSRCGDPIKLNCRSDLKKYVCPTQQQCEGCKRLKAAYTRQREEEAATALNSWLAEHDTQQRHTTCDYPAINDADALLLIALEAAITPRLTTGSFCAGDCEALCPGNPGSYLRQLYSAGILVHRPFEAMAGTYFLKDEALWFKQDQVQYALAPDTRSGDTDALLTTLASRHLCGGPGIAQLWLTYALQDVMAYFWGECRTYNHWLEPEAAADVESSFRHALHTYSVAQLWSVAWRVIRDAASLANRTYYNREKAAATIPGKVRRHLEKVQREGGTLKAWTRREDQPAGTLGMVFWHMFDIDEHTPGVDALHVLSQVGRQATPPEETLLHSAHCLVKAAAEKGIGAQVLLDVAALVQDGAGIQEAIQRVFDKHLGQTAGV